MKNLIVYAMLLMAGCSNSQTTLWKIYTNGKKIPGESWILDKEGKMSLLALKERTSEGKVTLSSIVIRTGTGQ